MRYFVIYTVATYVTGKGIGLDASSIPLNHFLNHSVHISTDYPI